jgi:ABC-2 type transport system permease protein
VLPLTFLSTVFMARGLMPSWMQVVAGFNPVNRAADGARAALAVRGD